MKIQKQLLSWYKKEKRDLPWRKSSDPYAIWISEIMLQQTQVATVIPYFNRWMDRFPTLSTLARAKEDEVVKAWEGLGYYSRARNIHKAAKLIMEEHDGIFPNTALSLSQLPGIGPYTLGAILSIAFNKKAAAVDGNVLRVFSRLFGIQTNIKDKQTIDQIRQRVLELQPKTKRSEMTQAWMELGALICLPKKPQCLLCPLSSLCQAKAQGQTEILPLISKRPQTKKIQTAALVIQHKGKFLLEKRPKGTIMGGLFIFPTVELNGNKNLKQLFENHLKTKLTIGKKIHSFRHSYTQYRAHLSVHTATALKDFTPTTPFTWMTEKQLQKTPLPAVHAKIAKLLFP